MLHHAQIIALVTCAGLLTAARTAHTPREEPVDFARDIRPILTDKCFLCHGPDEGAREADLRLDVAHSATQDRGGYAAIVPGDADASEVILRILDASDPMPPKKSELTLTDREKELLRRWVEEGAEWQEHWSYVPPGRPDVPRILAPGRSPIDAFVRKRLYDVGLSATPAADRATLIRRVTLDLTGIPPTVSEVDAFLADDAQGAYERVVDRLLASPRYGEARARAWLDAARYGDTHGFHLDNERTIWPYRDWVIQAYNDNKPFDEFTIEQLAGDLLPNATLDQQVATGFNRCNPTTAEGGLIDAEYLVKYAVDRVETMSTVWLGSTMGCAVCHDHKYDPFTQKEFYELFAFFNSIDENASDGNARDPKPVVKVPSEEQGTALAAISAKLEALEEEKGAPMPETDAAQVEWQLGALAEVERRWQRMAVASVTSSGGADVTAQDDGSWLVSGANPATDTFEVLGRTDGSSLRALQLELLTDASFVGNGVGRATNANIVLTDVEIAIAPAREDAEFTEVDLAGAWADYNQKNFHIEDSIDDDPKTGWAIDGRKEGRVAVFFPAESVGFEGGTRVRVRLAHDSVHSQHAVGRFRLSTTEDPNFGPARLGDWSSIGPFNGANRREVFDTAYGPEEGVDLAAEVREQTWTAHPEYADGAVHMLPGGIAATYLIREIYSPSARTMAITLGSDDGIRAWLNGAEVLSNDVPRAVALDQERVQLALAAGRNELLLKISNYGGAYGFSFRVADEDVGGLPMDVVQALGDADDEAQALVVREYYRRTHSLEWRTLEDASVAKALERTALEAAIPTTMVMRSRAEPRPAHLLTRGQYDQLGEEVQRGVPAAFPPLPVGEDANRLTLARWLMEPGHPLTARVTVNRMWMELFGQGLVETSEDFGSRGSWPTHPELLDWLAVEFVESGWNVKGMLRSLVLSSTYRQSARVSAELQRRDPNNSLYARGPRFRLGAEAVRDSALALSGLLVEQLGGPSVKPYQPPGLWKVVGYTSSNTANFVRDNGDALYRRSLYTFWKRTSPPPTMQIFDAPTRESCVVQRQRTNTPLQALALLNDEQFVEAARGFGGRILREGGADVEARLRWGYRMATAQEASDERLAVLRRILDRAIQEFESDPEATAALLGVGESPPDATLSPPELAAWTVLASTLMNLDAFVTKG
jgi:hypothetical protein